MKKAAVILSLMLALHAVAYAGGPRFSYGMEWGYTGSFLKTHQYNYIYSAGSRIIDYWPPQAGFFSNGTFLVNGGLDLSEQVNLSLYTGIEGVWSDRWMVPVQVRARWCPAGLEHNSFLHHAAADLTFPVTPTYLSSLGLHVGSGYRLMVYKSISVDFLLSLSIVGDHDQLIDPDEHYYIPQKDIMLNLSEYWGLNFSIALNF